MSVGWNHFCDQLFQLRLIKNKYFVFLFLYCLGNLVFIFTAILNLDQPRFHHRQRRPNWKALSCPSRTLPVPSREQPAAPEDPPLPRPVTSQSPQQGLRDPCPAPGIRPFVFLGSRYPISTSKRPLSQYSGCGRAARLGTREPQSSGVDPTRTSPSTASARAASTGRARCQRRRPLARGSPQPAPVSHLLVGAAVSGGGDAPSPPRSSRERRGSGHLPAPRPPARLQTPAAPASPSSSRPSPGSLLSSSSSGSVAAAGRCRRQRVSSEGRT